MARAPIPHRVWTSRRQWMGNLLPLLAMAPFGVAGAWLLIAPRGPVWIGYGLVVLSLITGWLTVNRWGLFQNELMRRALEKRFEGRVEMERPDKFFVGMARPRYRGLIDPHEDVGFLCVGADRLDYLGDRIELTIPARAVIKLGRRRNIHTLLCLGGWITVEGRIESTPFRLNLEPREATTLLGNKRFARIVVSRLDQWLKRNEPRAQGPGSLPQDSDEPKGSEELPQQ